MIDNHQPVNQERIFFEEIYCFIYDSCHGMFFLKLNSHNLFLLVLVKLKMNFYFLIYCFILIDLSPESVEKHRVACLSFILLFLHFFPLFAIFSFLLLHWDYPLIMISNLLFRLLILLLFLFTFSQMIMASLYQEYFPLEPSMNLNFTLPLLSINLFRL